MKKLTFLLILFSGFMFSQEFIINNNDLNYLKVVEIPNKSKNDIYKGIKSFLNSSARNTKYFIDTDNLEIGLISYNEKTIKFPISEFTSLSGSYKVTIDIKDNKFRYSINNFKFLESIELLKSEYDYNYSDYTTSLENNDNIEKLNQKLNLETKEKKRNQIIKEIENLKIEKELKKIAIEKIKNTIVDNINIYIQEIGKTTSDW